MVNLILKPGASAEKIKEMIDWIHALFPPLKEITNMYQAKVDYDFWETLNEQVWGKERDTYFYYYMQSTPVIIIPIIATKDRFRLIESLHRAIGNSDPDKALPDTFRHDFGVDQMRNAIHHPISKKAAKYEDKLLQRFKIKKNLFKY